MNEVEAAWVGAFIEAEGSWSRNDLEISAQIHVPNTDLEMISALFRATGVGTFTMSPEGNYQSHVWSQKTNYVWVLSCYNDVKALCQRCAPYSIKLQRGLAWFEDNQREERATYQ
jgi:hypothetical protein